MKDEWMNLLAQTATGLFSKECVEQFDRLTSLLMSKDLIEFDEFLNAQHVIFAAKKAAHVSDEWGL